MFPYQCRLYTSAIPHIIILTQILHIHAFIVHSVLAYPEKLTLIVNGLPGDHGIDNLTSLGILVISRDLENLLLKLAKCTLIEIRICYF